MKPWQFYFLQIGLVEQSLSFSHLGGEWFSETFAVKTKAKEYIFHADIFIL